MSSGRPGLDALPDPNRPGPRQCKADVALRGGFQLGIEVGDHVLERLDRLLDRSNLHQLPATDRPIAILQGNDEVASLLLQLNQWQAMVRQIAHRSAPTPFGRRSIIIAVRFCHSLTKKWKILAKLASFKPSPRTPC